MPTHLLIPRPLAAATRSPPFIAEDENRLDTSPACALASCPIERGSPAVDLETAGILTGKRLFREPAAPFGGQMTPRNPGVFAATGNSKKGSKRILEPLPPGGGNA